MRVDVLITGLPPGGNALDGPKVRTLLQNIQVLSAGVDFQKDREGKPEQAQVVNLLVTPAQAEILSLASNETHIQLVLRNPMDTQVSGLPGMIMSDLFGRRAGSGAGSNRRPKARTAGRASGSAGRGRACRTQAVHHRSVERLRAYPSHVQPAWREAMRTGQWYGAAPRRAACLVALSFVNAAAGQQTEGLPPVTTEPSAQSDQDSPTNLLLTVGKSVVIDNALPMERISVGFGDIVEGTAISPHQLLLNAKTPGVTSLIVWQEGGTRRFFDITVVASSFLADRRIKGIQREIERELPGQSVNLSIENETVFLRGTVKDVTSADRAVSIASTLGKTVNLLYVDVPPPEAQILLRVKFASIDRNTSTQLGLNILSTGAANTIGSATTQQFSPLSFSPIQNKTPITATIADALNLFFFRPDLNLGATIAALQVKGLLQILAEPNVLAQNGKQASFLAGGEFPFPSVSCGHGRRSHGYHSIPRVWRTFDLYSHHHAARNHSPGSSSRSERPGFYERTVGKRLHCPGADNAQAEYAGRIKRRTELRHRGTSR
jgi:hypothetical protein